MTLPISASAANAREHARQGTGQFGVQDHVEAGVVDVPDPNPNLTAIRAALAANPEHVLDVVAGMIADLGAHTEWDNDVTEGTTGDLTNLAGSLGLPRLGDQDRAGLKFYRAAALEEQDEECACQGSRSCDHDGPCEADPNEDQWGYDDMCRSCCDNAEDAEKDANEAGTGVCSECAANMATEPHSRSCSAHPDAVENLCSCTGGEPCDHSGDCGDSPSAYGNGMCMSCATLTGAV